MKPQDEAPQSSVAEGANGAIPAWVADERNRALGQELSLGEEKMHADLVRGGELRELAASKKIGCLHAAQRVSSFEESGANPLGSNLEDG